MRTLTLPAIVRAALAPRRPQPAPAPVIPRPRPAPDGPARPRPRTDLALAPTDPDGPPSCGPQAQGDTIVLPWLDFMSPHILAIQVRTARPVPPAGLTVLPSHVMLPEVGWVGWLWWDGPGPTLGTLVVPDGSVARLAHDEHGDLRIGPGVYAVRRQRRHTPAPAAVAWVED